MDGVLERFKELQIDMDDTKSSLFTDNDIEGLTICDSSHDTLSEYESQLSIVVDKSKAIFILPTINKERQLYFEKHFIELRDSLNQCNLSYDILSLEDNIQTLDLNSDKHRLPKMLFNITTGVVVSVISTVLSNYITTYSVKKTDEIKFEFIVKNGDKEKIIKYEGEVKNLDTILPRVENLFSEEQNVKTIKRNNIKK